MAWHLTLHRDVPRARWVRWFDYGYIPIALMSILLTASRGALLAALPGFMYIFLSLNHLKLHHRLTLLGGAIGSLYLLLPFVPQTAFQRLGNTGQVVSQGDLNGRLGIWLEGLRLFAEHPMIGVGTGAFRTANTVADKVAHNFALTLAVELGLIGLTLFLIILVAAALGALRQPRWRALFWLSVLMIWFLGASTHNWEYRKQTWLFLDLIAISTALYGRRRKDSPIPHEPVRWQPA